MEKYPESKFVWQDAYYCDNPVEDMGTSHLFYTLRMCWNAIVPSDLVIDFKKDWDFSPSPVYCKEYFQTAVIGILAELSDRNDIEQNFIKKIEFARTNIQHVPYV